MLACKLQGGVVSNNCRIRQFMMDKKGEPKESASSVVVQALVTREDTFKIKVPELTTTYKPTIPFIEKPTTEILERKVLFSSQKFGRFGGKFVPETLVVCLTQLEDEFRKAINDEGFQAELAAALRDYAGRETPLYHAQRFSEYYKSKNNGKGPDIYLKREDLNHSGSHKMNNALAQAMLAKRMGRKSVVTATGSGQHGLATAAACAKLGLKCTVFMAAKDMDRQSSNVRLMKLLGAKVEAVNGSFKDVASEAFRNWVEDLENSYHLTGSAVGPHPCPTMVREFQSVIGKETRMQALEKWGGKPDVLVASVGTGSNALGLFHEFIPDRDVRLIGVEAAGFGLDTGKHSSTLATGEVGVYHGAMTYLLQDEDGQIIQPHSIAAGMEYPGVSPELSFLKECGRAEFCVATDEEALDAYERLCKLEGIYPSLEAAHALAILDKLVPTLRNGSKVVVNCSGRGDKDAAIVFNRRQFDRE
ncbi:tryptophan synthase beta chain 1-like [Gastrolobium bilobum]|uniref:tryptophan synthase beta chain 1-like n=1 Tax=Gastrolobium bilobum TaxID=150636 RepID=UPI002AB1D00F|nr:tryptophan synthase beta chain 1-like [Gastrolobium bilobum]